MKKIIALCAGLLVAANLCAVVLPDGQNVRADNATTYESGALRSVTLRNDTDITTPGGVVRAGAGTTVYYYENGTPSRVTSVADTDITTPGGTVRARAGAAVYYYKNGIPREITPVADTDIATPSGTVRVAGAAYRYVYNTENGSMLRKDPPPVDGAGWPVYYYENGTVKSIVTRGSSITGKLRIQTNFGPIGNFNDNDNYRAITFTFYESGSLWYIGGDGLGSNILRTPNGDFTVSGEILFYDAGGADTQIVHKAGLVRKQSATVTTKAATFSLKGTSLISLYYGYRNDENFVFVRPRVEVLRYGIDDFNISFYKNGNIEKIFIDEDTAKDMSVQTSLGELFVRGNVLPLMFWEDGSIKQCVNDDVLQATIYGKNVTVPVGGLLRFRRDGSVWAYTTTSGVSFTIGKRAYTTNNTWRTPVFDEAGNVVQWLALAKDGDRNNIGLANGEFKFYDSGTGKKSGSPYIGMDGQQDVGNVAWWNENRVGAAFVYKNTLYYRPDANNSREQYTAKLECRDFLVDMVYFADNGYPTSYDVLKTTVDGDIRDESVRNEFELPAHLFIEMTEDSEFVIDRRVRGVQFTRQ